MADKKFYVNIDLNQNQLKQAVVENVSTKPAANAGKAGQIIYVTSDKKLYQHDGTDWVVVGKDYTEGTKIDVSTAGVIAHEATSRTDTTSSASPAAGGTFTVIDSVSQDSTGHVTGVNLKTVTLPSALAVNNGAFKIKVDGDESAQQIFTANQSTDTTLIFTSEFLGIGIVDSSTVSIEHPEIEWTTNSDSSSPAFGGTFTAITGIENDGYGHVSEYKTTTYTLPTQTQLSKGTSVNDGNSVNVMISTAVNNHQITDHTATLVEGDQIKISAAAGAITIKHDDTKTAVAAAAKKVGMDKYGHVVLGSALTASDVGAIGDVQINGVSIKNNSVANIAVDGTYNSSTNKIATVKTVTDAVAHAVHFKGSKTAAQMASITCAEGDLYNVTTDFYIKDGVISASASTGAVKYDAGTNVVGIPGSTAGTYIWDTYGNASIDLTPYWKTADNVSGTGDVTISGTIDNMSTTIGTGKVTNAMLAGSIENGKLANSSITIAGSAISLGGSITRDSILGLSTGTGFVKRTGTNSYSIDTNTYLTDNTISSSSHGVALGGKISDPTITVTPGSIVSGDTSVVTGGIVYTTLQDYLKIEDVSITEETLPNGDTVNTITVGDTSVEVARYDQRGSFFYRGTEGPIIIEPSGQGHPNPDVIAAFNFNDGDLYYYEEQRELWQYAAAQGGMFYKVATITEPDQLASVAFTGSYDSLDDAPNLNKGTTIGTGNVVTEISVNGHEITLTKGITALTSHQTIKTLKTDNTSAQATNASEAIAGSGTINLHKIAKTGTYSDLINKPTYTKVNLTFGTPASGESSATIAIASGVPVAIYNSSNEQVECAVIANWNASNQITGHTVKVNASSAPSGFYAMCITYLA